MFHVTLSQRRETSYLGATRKERGKRGWNPFSQHTVGRPPEAAANAQMLALVDLNNRQTGVVEVEDEEGNDERDAEGEGEPTDDQEDDGGESK